MKAIRRLPFVAALLLSSLPLAQAGGISTSTANGETVVEWNGKEVFRDKVDGLVKSMTSSVDGEELAAAVDHEGKVLWESQPGAAAALKLAPPAELPPAGKNAIKVESADGESVVTFQGKQVWKGEPKDDVSAQAKEVDGKTYAAAFDGNKVVWENVPGAAKKVGKPGRQARRL